MLSTVSINRICVHLGSVVDTAKKKSCSRAFLEAAISLCKRHARCMMIGTLRTLESAPCKTALVQPIKNCSGKAGGKIGIHATVWWRICCIFMRLRLHLGHFSYDYQPLLPIFSRPYRVITDSLRIFCDNCLIASLTCWKGFKAKRCHSVSSNNVF